MRIRRRSKRFRYVLLGIFVGVAFFTCLSQRFKDDGTVEAASLAGFDPGYIISDYQMGNYNSMSEKEIQAFLTGKNACSNTSREYYEALSAGSSYKWHFENGHFVCLSEELFGDGEVIGKGETAAHIIWQAAQDYKINPQVLIVLLQKETGLITDPIPNNGDYRKATGYGCPDTAPCSSEYYGFKNQVRKAAELFSAVLNGGWTNYPLGNNYIQYNPNASCGGSVVNIRSLATSALYRYTPYQPNAGAIAAGYGTAYCGAYGNRNFYLYFEDWFGGITQNGTLVGSFKDMVVPRLIFVKKGARYIVPETGEIGKRTFGSLEFFTHLNYQNEELCLAIGNNRNCYLYDDLEELDSTEFVEMDIPRVLIIKNNTKTIHYLNKVYGSSLKKGDRLLFESKALLGDVLCLKTQDMVNECVPYENLEELPDDFIKEMAVPRFLKVQKGAKKYNIGLGKEVGFYEESSVVYFDRKAEVGSDLCLVGDQKEIGGQSEFCVKYSDLVEVDNFVSMTLPRNIIIEPKVYYVDVQTGKKSEELTNSGKAYFVDKIYINNELCLRIKEDADRKLYRCIKYVDLKE